VLLKVTCGGEESEWVRKVTSVTVLRRSCGEMQKISVEVLAFSCELPKSHDLDIVK
jgi:hypothetical protein